MTAYGPHDRQVPAIATTGATPLAPASLYTRRTPVHLALVRRSYAAIVRRHGTPPLSSRYVFHGQDRVSTFFFSVSVPAGDGHLPDLMRQLADHLEGLGEVSVRDLAVTPAQQVGGYSVATVYYNRIAG